MYMFNCNAPNTYVDWEHNTLMFSGFSEVNLRGFGVGTTFHNNIFVQNGGSGYYNGMTADLLWTFTADYNLYYGSLTGTTNTYMFPIDYVDRTFSNYKAATGQDTNGMYANPRFANLPTVFVQGNFGDRLDFSPDHFHPYTPSDLSLLAVGDYFEIDGDGVARQITAINTTSNFVAFTPSSAQCSIKYGTAFDWKTNTNFTDDLTLQAGSPAINAASDGGNIGSSINLANYRAGNFGAYGSRPTCWPYTPINVTTWAASTTTQGFATVTDGQTPSSPNDVLKGFKATADAALNSAAITTSAISIVDTGGTSYSSYISSASLDSTGKILTVTLSSSLPTSKTYIIALNPAITAVNGGPVQGAKSVKIVDN
jgi:hypothetical protein